MSWFIEFENQQLSKAVVGEKQQNAYLVDRESFLKDAVKREQKRAEEMEKSLYNNKLQNDLNKRSLEW